MTTTEDIRLGAVVSLRLDADMLERLNALEAKLRGAGRRDCNRSTIIRIAIDLLLANPAALTQEKP